MQPNGEDIRFTWYNSTANEEVEIPYWFEKVVSSSYFETWVKAPEIPANDYATIYVYYGNTTPVTSESNADEVFNLYDDFLGTSLNTSKWETHQITGSGGSATVNDGILVVYSGQGTSSDEFIVNSTTQFSRPLIVEMRVRTENWGGTGSAGYYKEAGWGLSVNSRGGTVYLRDFDGVGGWGFGVGEDGRSLVLRDTDGNAEASSDITAINPDNWNTYRFVWKSDGSVCVEIPPGTQRACLSTYPFTGTDAVHFDAEHWGSTSYWQKVDVDWVRVRKYSDPEPTYSIGSEETGGNYPPKYSDIVVSPSSPQTYGISNIWFNITWYDNETSVDKAWIVHNFTGTEQTYYMSNDTATHFYYLLDFIPAAGTYVYTFYANDTDGLTNQTQTFTYIINKATTTLHLAINGTESDATYTYPAPTNATAWTDDTGFSGVILYRNGTSVSNPEIIQLAAGTYNYTAVLDHQNYTATPVTRFLTINKADSGLTLTASPGWTVVEGQEASITCLANEPLSVTLYKDGNKALNPYAAILPFGHYNFTCVISDTQNYTPAVVTKFLSVTPSGLICVNSTAYAFKKTIIPTTTGVVLNFTTFVENNFVNPDLSDVYVANTSLTVRKNTTNGYYLWVNTTGVSSFDVYFGNYIASNDYEEAPIVLENVTNVEEYYEQANPYYVLNLIDEKTGDMQLPSGANTTITLFCSQGTSSFTLNRSKILIPAFEILDSVRATVQYSPTEIYYRDLLVRSSIEYKNIYVVDANQHQVVQILFQLQDNTGRFDNAILKVKKYIEGSLITITELYFDAEDKAIVYLVNGDKYQLFVDNGEEERSIGYIYVDPSDLTKTIVLSELTTTNVSVANTTYSLSFEDGIISFTWKDPNELTQEVNMWVYNYTSNEELYHASSTNHSYVNFVYVTPDANATYKVKIEIKHPYFGQHSWGFVQVLSGAAALIPTLTIPPLGIAVFLFAIPMLFSAGTAGIAGIVVVAFAGLLVYLKQYTLATPLLAIAVVIAVLNLIRQRGEEGV